MGDMAICIGPPSTIVGGCPTVLIGTGTAGAASAVLAAKTSAAMVNTAPDSEGSHFFDVSLMDKHKLPITGYGYELSKGEDLIRSAPLGGRVKLIGIDEGEYDLGICAIVNVQWSTMNAEVGDSVDMTITTVGISDGVPAKIEVFVKDSNFTDYLLEKIETEVSGDEISESFTLAIDEKYLEICDKKESKGKFSNPLFFFRVTIDDLIEQSGLLRCTDKIELQLIDGNDAPISNAKYTLSLSNGSIKKGTTDSQGNILIPKDLPGKFTFGFDDYSQINIEST